MTRSDLDRDAVATQVRAAADGDHAAFDQLVDRFSGLVWSVLRAHGLPQQDAEDAFQTTWLRLVEHLDRLRDPRAIGGWLATTARHEALRLLRTSDRTQPVADEELDGVDERAVQGDARVLLAERDAALWAAYEELEVRCRQLLRVLMADPPPSYEEISLALELPIGSIGPTRGRCLSRLRDRLRRRGITDAVADSGWVKGDDP